VLAELRAHPAHVDVDRARTAVVVEAPHAAEQRLAAEHPTRVRDEELQELVLHVGEVHGPSSARDLVGGEVHRERPDADDVVVGDAAHAAARAGDAGAQLLAAQRQQDELVALVHRAGASELAVGDRDDDRDVAEVLVGLEPRADARLAEDERDLGRPRRRAAVVLGA
jgi:hypothetical protein